jgi:uncharacterized membrane protein
MVPEQDVIPLGLTVDEAVRYILSCGVLLPGSPALAPERDSGNDGATQDGGPPTR